MLLKDGRFAIRLGGMIDLDHGMGGLLGIDGNGNGHGRERRRRNATGSCTT